MKKAIKKTCVVLLLFALLVSQVAASYSETGTLNEGTSAISAAERYLSNWAYNSYMYADIVAVKRPAPRDHVDGIVVEQLQLRCKLGDVVPRAGAGGQELILAAAKAGQYGKRLLGAGVGDVVTFIKNKLDFIAKLLDIAPDLLFVLADLVQR